MIGQKQSYIEETIVNCLICVLIFLLLHDMIASVCIFIIQTILQQETISNSSGVYTFLQNNVTMLAYCVGDIIGIPFFVYWIRKYTHNNVTEYRENASHNVGNFIVFTLVAISASITFNGVFILSGFTKLFSNDYEQTTNQLYNGTLIVTVLFSGIIAPITEELLYRRILYSQMREQYGRYIACISSSLFFGIAHMAIVQGLYGFLTGILLCYCYEVGKGIKTSIFVHMIMNLTSIIGTQLLYTMTPSEQKTFWLIGSIVGVCIIIVFIKKTKAQWIRKQIKVNHK